MARQIIKLGAFWDVVIAAINANFGELYDAQGNAVTAEELTEQLASYVTNAALNQKLAGYTTTEALAAAIADRITAGDLNATLNGYVSTTALAQQLANYITASALNQQLAGYATTAALNNKVDKIAGKDLSTNDYTNAEKEKLAEIKAPTKHDFTVNSWGTADSNGVYSMAITSNQHVANVFRADGSNYENAAVAISVNGGTITIKSEETFAGYVILV